MMATPANTFHDGIVGPKERLYWLDWIRFLAALLVVVGHCRGTNWVEWGSLVPSSRSPLVFVGFAIGRVGYEAVVVFFVLSGFLVGGKTAERIWTHSFRLRAYAIDRVARIYVPLIPALGLTALAAVVSRQDLQIGQLAVSMVGLQEVVTASPHVNPPLWSLAYEIWFYFGAGACGYLIRTRSQRRVPIFFVLLGCMALFTRLDPTFLFCWLTGALAYSVKFQARRVAVFSGVVVVLLGTAASQLSTMRDQFSMFPRLGDLIPDRRLSFMALAAGAAIVVASICRSSPSSRLVRKFERIGTPLASFSYTLYLTHSPTLALWQGFKPAKYNSISVVSVAAFSGQLLACLGVAFMMYLLSERHTADVRRWLTSKFGLQISQRTHALSNLD
jgi:peptidoglycan/LPS O-acetylase OafA/YrhL